MLNIGDADIPMSQERCRLKEIGKRGRFSFSITSYPRG